MDVSDHLENGMEIIAEMQYTSQCWAADRPVVRPWEDFKRDEEIKVEKFRKTLAPKSSGSAAVTAAGASWRRTLRPMAVIAELDWTPPST